MFFIYHHGLSILRPDDCRDNASLMPYGTFVEFISGKDDLLHISEIGWKRLETVVLIKIVMIAGLAGSTETKIRSYTLIYNPG